MLIEKNHTEPLTLTHSLTHSWSRALLEKPPIVQLLENFPAFYGTVDNKGKCVWLLCGSSVAVPKKHIFERHFQTNHSFSDTTISPKSELWENINELRSKV
jgi:hypothetical protein